MEQETKDKEFDITQLTQGMSPEEAMEFIRERLTPQAVEEFQARKRTDALQERYQKALNTVDLRGLTPAMRARKVSSIKAKYQKLGLEVW